MTNPSALARVAMMVDFPECGGAVMRVVRTRWESLMIMGSCACVGDVVGATISKMQQAMGLCWSIEMVAGVMLRMAKRSLAQRFLVPLTP
eukprot:3314906-Rhodomonas_salina.1